MCQNRLVVSQEWYACQKATFFETSGACLPVNKNVMTDSYPAKTQEEMLAKTRNAKLITLIDSTKFYSQWRVHPDAIWTFTVTTAEGQYTFSYAIMGYTSSMAYIQRPSPAESSSLFTPTPAAAAQ
ncbi:hypothetical protein B0T19DRAFT_441399 [Cercophora scortea]|uniref:Uncharacterized protein n=1 Tax=Cercophora scortea TaxID=314031 RepID=A0AAE0MCE6_9PEZI|nr:hypothetical protein B0T19DRAFT_441399 [Cercophora scortea]